MNNVTDTFTKDVLRVVRGLYYSSEEEIANTLVSEGMPSGEAFNLVKAAKIVYNDEHGKSNDSLSEDQEGY